MNKPNKVLILDTETTGFEDDDKVIQIGSIMRSKFRTYTDEAYTKTTKKISTGSMTAHGIRKLPDDAVFIDTTKTVKRINKLGKNDVVMGHNIDFDLHMLRDEITNDKFIIVDTLLIARFMRKVGMMKQEDKVNLQYLRYLWLSDKQEKEIIKKYKPAGGAHSALFDCLITDAIAEHMINELAYFYLEDPADVWTFVSNLYKDRFNPDVVEIPFGKYKDKTVLEVYSIQSDYLEWFYDNVNGAENVKKAIMILSNQLKTQEK